LRKQIHLAATPQTVVCRCEDVSLSQLQDHHDWRAAKLATRCGMGSCQGRICGAALAELRVFDSTRPASNAAHPTPVTPTPATTAHSARPPVFPTRLASLAGSFSSEGKAAEHDPAAQSKP
jgi:hypothetical protein